MIENPALRAGFLVLLRTNGEDLNFRSASVRAVVSRDPLDRIVRTPDFDPRDASEIRLRISAVSGAPRAGEEFVDERGMAHRVQTIKRLHDVYSCRCQTSEPLYDGIATEGLVLITTESVDILQAA